MRVNQWVSIAPFFASALANEGCHSIIKNGDTSTVHVVASNPQTSATVAAGAMHGLAVSATQPPPIMAGAHAEPMPTTTPAPAVTPPPTAVPPPMMPTAPVQAPVTASHTGELHQGQGRCIVCQINHIVRPCHSHPPSYRPVRYHGKRASGMVANQVHNLKEQERVIEAHVGNPDLPGDIKYRLMAYLGRLRQMQRKAHGQKYGPRNARCNCRQRHRRGRRHLHRQYGKPNHHHKHGRPSHHHKHGKLGHFHKPSKQGRWSKKYYGLRHNRYGRPRSGHRRCGLLCRGRMTARCTFTPRRIQINRHKSGVETIVTQKMNCERKLRQKCTPLGHKQIKRLGGKWKKHGMHGKKHGMHDRKPGKRSWARGKKQCKKTGKWHSGACKKLSKQKHHHGKRFNAHNGLKNNPKHNKHDNKYGDKCKNPSKGLRRKMKSLIAALCKTFEKWHHRNAN